MQLIRAVVCLLFLLHTHQFLGSLLLPSFRRHSTLICRADRLSPQEGLYGDRRASGNYPPAKPKSTISRTGSSRRCCYSFLSPRLARDRRDLRGLPGTPHSHLWPEPRLTDSSWRPKCIETAFTYCKRRNIQQLPILRATRVAVASSPFRPSNRSPAGIFVREHEPTSEGPLQRTWDRQLCTYRSRVAFQAPGPIPSDDTTY